MSLLCLKLPNFSQGKSLQLPTMPYTSSPQPFWHQGPVSWKTIFPRAGGGASGVGIGAGGNASDGEQQMKLCAATHLLLCGPVPKRPWTGNGPRPGSWGPLPYTTFYLSLSEYITYSQSVPCSLCSSHTSPPAALPTC